MFMVKRAGTAGSMVVALADAGGQPVTAACEFLAYVAARGCSPNTVLAYAHDLAHLWRFLCTVDLEWDRLTAEQAVGLLLHLRNLPSKRRGHGSSPALATNGGKPVEPPRLSPATVNRILAAISAFYEWAILCDRFDSPNPIARHTDRSILMVSGRHRSFLAGIAPLSPSVRVLRVRTPRRLPRPLDPEQVARLLPELRTRRDLAMVRLMLDGGLRPGEVLGLHLTDVAYGRRRVVVRHRDDHPRGARSKSRTERIVDLHEAVTLEAVSAYVMSERPADAISPLMFLVGGHGPRRNEPLSYAALARLFARACERAGVRARRPTSALDNPACPEAYARHADVGGRNARAHSTEAAWACQRRGDAPLYAGIGCHRRLRISPRPRPRSG